MTVSRRNSVPRAICLILACLLLLAGCGEAASTPTAIVTTSTDSPATAISTTSSSQSEGEVVVFAASSLQDAFKQVASGMKDKVTFNFAGSQALITQLSQGARADVFASADAKNMKAAIEAGTVVSGTHQILVTNRLVVITPLNSTQVTSLTDLAKPGLKLVLADKSVPAGNYSMQIIDKMAADPTYGQGFKEKALANVVSRETDVRQVLAKVQLGEADAGIVYTTDAKSSQQALGTIEIPETFNVVATYYIAPLKDAQHPEAARQFIEYVLSDAGQNALQGYGFGSSGANK